MTSELSAPVLIRSLDELIAALAVVASGSAPALRLKGHLAVDIERLKTGYVNRFQSVSSEGEDLFQFRYNGQRGGYFNGFACLRARAPVATQYAFRAHSHSAAGASQEVASFALSDGTDLLVTKVNGDTSAFRDLIAGRNLVLGAGGTVIAEPSVWIAAVLGANITAHTAVAPATQLFAGRVFLRGSIAWAAQTLAGGTTLLTVDSAHRPATTKVFSVRSSATSNVSTLIELAVDGTLVNGTSFGTTTSAHVGLDGLSWDLS